MEKVIQRQINNILDFLNEYKEKTNARGVVLGISGGKDSTVVAMLAKKVWGDNVMGILMPNGNQIDLADSIYVAETLNLNYRIINIDRVFNTLLNTIDNEDQVISEKAITNIPPRLRMTTLYAIAQSLGYRVIGTGNMSEGYIGWCTKWGDTACDLNPLAFSTCTDVIEMGKILAKEFGLDEKYIVKTPSDGLTGKSDEANFGFSYKDLDNYILYGECEDEELQQKIEKMHRMSAHKRNMPYTRLDYID